MTTAKVWRERSSDGATVAMLATELGVPEIVARLLVNRDIVDLERAREFLNPRLASFREPFSFIDMDLAVRRIAVAIERKERIGIFGDYDVDGVCSTALLADFFEALGVATTFTLPCRHTEGYGLSMQGIERLKNAGASLIITVDCGVTATAQVEFARSLGIDVVVVDHHEPGPMLPSAVAVVNPKRLDCPSDASFLCAAGVSFFLCMALRRHLRESGFFKDHNEPDVKNLLDLVALATVCDVVPLVKENRTMTRFGLTEIKKGTRVGLNALIDRAQLNKSKISATNLGFHLGPRINAAGRLSDATQALELMLTKDHHEARCLADGLDGENSERRILEKETVGEVVKIIEASHELQDAGVVVVYDERFHSGVAGIVASRIAEKYHKPAIIIGAGGKGSGRSIKGVDLHSMVKRCEHHLAGFGGHAHAIGLTLKEGQAAAFFVNLAHEFALHVPKEVYVKEIFYDAAVKVHMLTLDLVREIRALEPFGAKNPSPVVRINRCYFRNLRVLTGGHVKGELEASGGAIPFIAFGTIIDEVWAAKPVDVLGIPEENDWQGRVTLNFRLIDFVGS